MTGKWGCALPTPPQHDPNVSTDEEEDDVESSVGKRSFEDAMR